MKQRPKCDKCNNPADAIENDTFYYCANCWLKWMNKYTTQGTKDGTDKKG